MNETTGEPGSQQEWLWPLFRCAVLVWACEIVLVRASSPAVRPIDIAISLLGYAAIAAVSWLIVRGLRAPWRISALGLLGLAPLTIAVSGIAGFSALITRDGLSIGLTGLGMAAMVVGGFVAHRHKGNPCPNSWFIVGSLVVATGAGWYLRGVGVPPLKVIVPCLLGWLALGFLSTGPKRLVAGGLGVVVSVLMTTTTVDVSWPEDAVAVDGPDIILLTVDTLRADAAVEMDSYKRIAKSGVAFSAVLAASPWTTPSLATIQTGVPYDVHGAGLDDDRQWIPIADGVPTLAELLSKNGYDTAAVLAPNPSVGRSRGFQRGFRFFTHASEGISHSIPRILWKCPGSPVLPEIIHFSLYGYRACADAREVSDLARKVLERRRNRPLFLWVHYLDPHFPYTHADETEFSYFDRLKLEIGLKGRLEKDPDWWSNDGLAMLKRAYENEVNVVDREILRLLEDLEVDGAHERVVVMVSDHGEELFEHGGFEHGHALYEEVVGVPLVISHLPGIAKGTVVNSAVGHEDIAPTLLALAGVSPSSMHGQSLMRGLELRKYVSKNMLHGGDPNDRIAVREGPWKAIIGPGKRTRLFHLDRDPNENEDLAPTNGERVTRLAGELRRERQMPVDHAAPLVIAEEEHRLLRALGYVE